MYCTTYDVQSTQGYVAEAVERLSISLLLHLLNQNICLFIHHFQEVREDREVEGWSQHFTPVTPLLPCAVGRKVEKSQVCDLNLSNILYRPKVTMGVIL